MLVRRTSHCVAAQHHSATVSPHKVNDSTTREVAADSMEHYSGQHFGLFLPDADHRVVSLNPLLVGGLYIDRHPAEPVGPFDLCPKHVWMARRHRSYSTQSLNVCDQVIVEVSTGIPQQVARGRLDQQCTLADSDRRFDRDAVQ